MDISLDDLLALEPRLFAVESASVPIAVPGDNETAEVTWAVSARATAPHLPLLRGGELLLVSERVASALGSTLPSLMQEAAARSVSAVVLEQVDLDEPGSLTTYPESQHVPILFWQGRMTEETEATINRLLTACRGMLYRIGTELERQIADLALNGGGIAALVEIVADTSGLPIAVLDANGRQLAAAMATEPSLDDSDRVFGGPRIRRELPAGAWLAFADLDATQRVTARFLADRIALAASAALLRDDAARPRGQMRSEATEALLRTVGSASEQRAAALALGLDPDAVYFVAVSHGATDSMLVRGLASLGSIHAAGTANGRRAILVAATSRAEPASLVSRVGDVKRTWEATHAQDRATLALSAPAFGVASLPSAAREANFVAALQTQAQFPKRAASFESVADIGALRLLYQLRNSNELRTFVSEALGTLENRDHRGTLRATLRAFLESGGSQVDASQRLGIHRNTLAYRLRRIGELVGGDIADPGRWLTLHLALCASEMLQMCGDDR